MRKPSAEIEQPVSFAMVQYDNDPDAWRAALVAADAARATPIHPLAQLL